MRGLSIFNNRKTDMETLAIPQKLAAIGIVPVLVLEQLDDGLRMCDTLISAGLPVAEITFRTQAAPTILQAARKRHPEMLLGAGTILDVQSLRRAFDGGADFAVAPGYHPAVAAEAQQQGWFFVPGVCTPTEMEAAWSAGFRLLKFYPAEAMGGANTLKAMAAPYRHLGVRYMPTGGITPKNMEAYLSMPEVACVGGTWMGPPKDIAAGRWDGIAQGAREAAAAVRAIRAR